MLNVIKKVIYLILLFYDSASITDYVIWKENRTLNELGMDGEEKSSSDSKFTKVKCQVVHAYVMNL